MAWRRFLGFLTIEEPSALDGTSTERLTTERARRFAEHLGETNRPQSVAGQIDMLYKAARVLMPECDWAWLKTIKARLYAVPPMSSAAKPVITSLQLLELGMQLMSESRPVPDSRIRLHNAVRYRDGLLLALLAFMPLRRKNLTALEIGRHFVRTGDVWHVILPANETKTSNAVEFTIPDLLRANLYDYLCLVRPRLLRDQTCRALWISARGTALSYSEVGLIIHKHSMAQLGIHLSPHDARDAAATTWAIAAPTQIGVARDLLAHADLRTTTKHYNRARGIEASRAYAKRIAAIRRDST
jgi:integrase